MGFFDLFRKKVEPDIISFEQLSDWLDTYIERKNLEIRFQNFKEELQAGKNDLSSSLIDLENSGLMNPNIPERVKHAIEGNRKTYLRRMRDFIKDIGQPENYNSISEFTAKISEDIVNLIEDTAKNQRVLNKFFATDIKAIMSKIKNIRDISINFLQEMDKENLSQVGKIRHDLEKLSKEKNKREELKAKKIKFEKDVTSLKKEGEKIESRIDDLKKGASYKKYQKDQEEKKENLEKIDALKTDLTSDFSILERALKKYSYNTPDEKIVQKYISGPYHAIQEDSGLKISTIIEEMKGKLSDLSLKDSKMESTKEVCEKLSPEYLAEIKKEIESIKKNVNTLSKHIQNSVILNDISQQKSLLKKNESVMNDNREKIEKLESELDTIDIDRMQNEIKEKVKEFANIEFSGNV